MPLNRQQQQFIAAHLEYFRDLGVSDFYQREATIEIPAEAAAVVVPSATEEVAETAPTNAAQCGPKLIEDLIENRESVIPPRNPFPSHPPVGSVVSPKSRAAALRVIQDEIGNCTRCALSAGRNKIVFGDGDPNARLMFVGEGPGADEDAQGLPFVGRAGQLLNNMIGAMGLKREQVYIANIVKCRPPQNRTPEPEEAHTCLPFVLQQLDVVRPEVVVALGSTAATYLMGARASLSGLRGRVHSLRGAKLIVTYHPAYLLRDPRQKKEAWQDLQLAMSELGLSAPSR